MILKSLFYRFLKPKVRKNVTVYISEKHAEIIIAPLFSDSIGGYLYEQENCEVIDLKSSYERIGEVLKTNFNKFDIKENKREKHNKSDWPAFKASKEKTMSSFEKNYTRFKISGANEYNIILVIETAFNNLTQIELTTAISYHCEDSALGQRIIKLFNTDIIHKS